MQQKRGKKRIKNSHRNQYKLQWCSFSPAVLLQPSDSQGVEEGQAVSGGSSKLRERVKGKRHDISYCTSRIHACGESKKESVRFVG